MILIKATISTDWKGRSDHTIRIIKTGTTKALQKEMAKQIALVQLDDLVEEANEAADEDPNKKPLSKEEQKALLVNPKFLAQKWEDVDRWEMEKSGNATQRMLCGENDGETWSVSLTILPQKGIA